MPKKPLAFKAEARIREEILRDDPIAFTRCSDDEKAAAVALEPPDDVDSERAKLERVVLSRNAAFYAIGRETARLAEEHGHRQEAGEIYELLREVGDAERALFEP